jgi:hypothetical protein
MAFTYEPIASYTAPSNVGSITFSSVPATYTDIRVVFSGKGNNYMMLRFNTDATTNYSYTSLFGDGGTNTSSRATSQNEMLTSPPGYGLGSGQPVLVTMDILSYAGSTFKTVLGIATEAYNGGGFQGLNVGLWRSTAAINEIQLYAGGAGQSFLTGCVATLYGIKAA